MKKCNSVFFTLGQKSTVYPKSHILKLLLFFTKFTISKSHFFTKFTFFKHQILDKKLIFASVCSNDLARFARASQNKKLLQLLFAYFFKETVGFIGPPLYSKSKGLLGLSRRNLNKVFEKKVEGHMPANIWKTRDDKGENNSVQRRLLRVFKLN